VHPIQTQVTKAPILAQICFYLIITEENLFPKKENTGTFFCHVMDLFV